MHEATCCCSCSLYVVILAVRYFKCACLVIYKYPVHTEILHIMLLSRMSRILHYRIDTLTTATIDPSRELEKNHQSSNPCFQSEYTIGN